MWGTAILNARGEPTEMLDPVGRLTVDENNAVYPGLTLNPKPFLSPTYNLPVADFFFWGTDLELWLRHDQTPGTLMTVLVDGEEQPAIDLGDGSGVMRVSIVRGLTAGVHRVRLQDAATRMDSLVAIQVGYRPTQSRYWFSMYVGLLAVIQLAVIAWTLARHLLWQRPWRSLRRVCARVAGWGGPIWTSAAWALLLASPVLPLRLLGLAMAGLGALLWPLPALGAAVLAIPFAPITVPLGIGRFAVTEIAILLAVAGRVVAALLDRWSLPRDERSPWRLRLSWLDGAVVAVVALGILTALLAEYRTEALRELRVVIAESALLYALVRTAPVGRKGLLRLADLLWIAGLAVAAYALVYYATPSGVIEAEGVRRARAFYGLTEQPGTDHGAPGAPGLCPGVLGKRPLAALGRRVGHPRHERCSGPDLFPGARGCWGVPAMALGRHPHPRRPLPARGADRAAHRGGGGRAGPGPAGPQPAHGLATRPCAAGPRSCASACGRPPGT